MSDLDRRIAKLPRDMLPATDLWPAIETRLRSDRRLPAQGAGRAFQRAGKIGALVAAALVLVAAALYGLRGPGLPVRACRTPSRPRPVTTVAPVDSAAWTRRHFEQAIEPLRRRLDARRDELSAETIRVVEEQLVVIDGAIAELRRALAADPGDGRAERFFAGLYFSKIRLLERANSLPAGT
ncbi:MAG: hypothetical protein Q9Q40_08280 [Acidobacteriota bacterium]|nr:hypothetical protein [Acidobacteriota bacterium]MDQ7087767.1 hypothetical protein [Acidobacteriota bacterium]